MYPLLRVSLTLVTSVLYCIGLTPPNPPPPPAERSKALKTSVTSGVGILEGLIRFIPFSARFLVTCFAILESTVILAQSYPSTASTYILHFLCPTTVHQLGQHAVCMSPDSIGIPTSIQMWIGMISVWIGGGIRMACYRELGRLFTYELTIREKHTLVTSGPYSIVRHPSYTGCAILAIGMSIYHLSPGTYWTDSSLMHQTYFGKLVALLWTVILVYSALVFMRAEKEDKMLKEEFGKEWEEWAERTKWRFIPWVA